MSRKKKRLKALVPYYIGGVVVLRIPKGTPRAEADKAKRRQRNLARKISNDRSRWHYTERYHTT